MKICYFGIYDPDFGRNKVYMAGLRALGHEVIECRDTSPGFLKYARLKRKHAAILAAGGYDAMIVGYPGHIVVPLAKKLAVHAARVLGGPRRPVVFDALCTLYEGEILSRGKYATNPFMRAWIRYIDEKAAEAADRILVETEAQRKFFVERFDLDPAKVTRVFTGVDESVFNTAVTAKAAKKPMFTAVFRGKFLPEAGVEHVVLAAKILEGKGVNVLILGHGFLEDQIRAHIERVRPANLEWISDKLPLAELARRMAECHVSLGQFGNHERLERTIPHKCFESLALGLPYVTAKAGGVGELLTDGVNCLMIPPADPHALADVLEHLKANPSQVTQLSGNSRKLFDQKLGSTSLARDILAVLS